MTDPTPVRCPAIADPDAGLAHPGDFDPLLARLAVPDAVVAPEEFPRGTVQPDGRLDLCKQGVGPAQTARIVAAVVDSPLVRHLLLGTNGLGADGARAVAEALRPGHRLQTLYLGCNRIDPVGVEALAARLAGDDTVRALWLKRNPVGDEGVRRLAAALAVNSAIRTLDLVNVGMSVRGLAALADALTAREQPVQRLFLGGNGFGPDAVPALGALVRDAGVRELYLAANHLGDAGAAALAELLDGMAVTIGLGGNGITPVGVAALARHLGSWRALDLARPPSERALGARGNVVGDEGAALLADALPAARLRRLDLRRTEVGGRGARRLVEAVEGHPTLEYLGINGGVPRRQRRRASALLAERPVTPPHEDIRAIASVYR
ncbi:gala protein [Micromonospora echinospora]|uniref:Leucine Rich repeat n=1 Tax=Micromonospora echinospora TaxID=1877 RepID=A0A1C4Z248_MICEC|nr:gala protein [Micromonospora echinospora]OZV77493.1 gala protein [Micromonospora echinospora]SCF26986.1 Leucine Rich repeat [Micromonospora echinospora]